ncbi:unnamed protein product [Darwinula stevensoni]|uniref:N-acetyltransferase domain-containing protein n=1 Tax=Darwinula stevensoni TaxID=69355 RepID=A0A7R9AI72_9CRUS|nr:unnamed protein product [Darwinula stevensoni]CAG0905661.1 unnamed protein product [Darwinula stevensoni]
MVEQLYKNSASESPVVIRMANWESEREAVEQILLEYEQGLAIDLCFQGFAQELQNLPIIYKAPEGAMLLAWVDGQLAGCCALRPLPESDHTNAAEMKRLFVRKAFRGFGLGRMLSEATLEAAKMAAYDCVLLDTLEDMQSARSLYADLGFYEIDPYYDSPIKDAHYLKADL